MFLNLAGKSSKKEAKHLLSDYVKPNGCHTTRKGQKLTGITMSDHSHWLPSSSFFCENTSVKNTLFPVYFKIFDIRLIHLGCSIEIQALSRTMDAHQGNLARYQSEWYAKHAGKSLTSFGGLSHATYYDAMILKHINTIYVYINANIKCLYMYVYVYM